jgi:hypothetical protein
MLLSTDEEGVSGRGFSENHDWRFPIVGINETIDPCGFADSRVARPPWTRYKTSTCCMKTFGRLLKRELRVEVDDGE